VHFCIIRAAHARVMHLSTVWVRNGTRADRRRVVMQKCTPTARLARRSPTQRS
jgi:hypothetical protein